MKAFSSYLLAFGLTEVSADSYIQTSLLTFNPGCPAPCTMCDDQPALAKCLREAELNEVCTAVSVGVTYVFNPDVNCSMGEGIVWDKMTLDTALDDLSTAGSLDHVLFDYAMFRYKKSPPETTSDIALSAITRADDCSGNRTELPVDATLYPVDKSITFWPSDRHSIPLDIKHDDIVVTSNGSVTESYFLGVLRLQAVYQLSPYLAEASVTFDEEDCHIPDCESLSDLESVLHCLKMATFDERCKTAIYTRTYKSMGAAPCDADKPQKFFMSLEPIYYEENAIESESKIVTITDVSFGEKTSTPKACGQGKVVFASDCSSEGSPTVLHQADPSGDDLIFTGEQNLDMSAEAPRGLIASYPESSGDCKIEWDARRKDTLAARTLLVVNHKDNKSESGQGWWAW